MKEIKCAFCEETIPFTSLAEQHHKIVSITVEREEDGAGVWYEYWAHEDCLPQELLTEND